MALWTFYGYCTPAGTREVQNWYRSLLPEERDEARDTLSYLGVLGPADWRAPQFKPLGDGLSEIRFRVNTLKKTFRIYGCFWPRGVRYSYTFLLGRDKKRSNPKSDIAEARKRKSGMERGEGAEHEFEFSSGPDR